MRSEPGRQAGDGLQPGQPPSLCLPSSLCLSPPEMSGAGGLNGSSASPAADYEWRYEYYDDEEPVSFEGLKAHRYSIVIGFWVGLAVFVIFMFFLLTLLTKTGAPHPDSSGQPCEIRLIGYMDTNLSNGGAPPPHPCGLDSSCSLFQCYMAKEGQGSSRAPWTTAGSLGGGAAAAAACLRRPGDSVEAGGATLLQELAATADRTEKEAVLLAHFDIPNCVSADQSSAAEEEPELPIILEGRDQSDGDSNDHSDFT